MPFCVSHLPHPHSSIAAAAVTRTSAFSSATSLNRAWTTRYENVLGTSMQLTLRAASRAHAEAAEAALLADIDRHDHLLSAWRPESELNRWMSTRGTAEKVSPELLEVLGLFDQWRDRTDGAIDASAEAAIRLWKTQDEPGSDEIAQTIAAMQQPHWRLDADEGTATRLSSTPLVLASFTKSYIADRAVDAALAAGASGAMLNIGGDIIVRGNLTQMVNIADPFAHSENDAAMDTLALRDRSIATSGLYRRGAHIVDPRSALPVSHIASSTVVARDPATAGALATAFTILSVDETRELAANTPGTEYLLVTREGERIASDGWGSFQSGFQQKKKAAPAAAADAWNQSYELAIDLEVATQNGGPRSHRPYVAVWIEDDHHESVRTLALWYDKMRYLPELRDWAHDNQMRIGEGHPDVALTVASATRSPGKYTLKWDGKDDDGKLVKPGKYTVCIEAAREHGGTQIIRRELDFNGTPQQQAVPAGAELGPVTLDYRKQ
jgi:thiamine biosynthesis lipoprotein